LTPATSANFRSFAWSGRSDRAALLVAEDLRTDAAIAAEAGISDRQLRTWKAHPDFAARVDQVRAELRAAVLAEGIASRQNRVDALNERWRRMQRVIDARAIEHADVPGGDTGLLVRQIKLVKIYSTTSSPDDVDDPDDTDVLISAKMNAQVAEYAVDTGLLKELREHEKQAAQELGQWTEKQELSGSLLIREYVGVDLEGV
jgi:hypothetical protein